MVRRVFDVLSACVVAHLTWTLSTQGYRLREGGISLSNMVSLVFSAHYLISYQAQAHSVHFRLQCKPAVVSSQLVFLWTCLHMCFRPTRELLAFFSSFCTYYAWICSASFEPRTRTRPLHSLNVTTPRTSLSSPTGSCLPWFSSSYGSGRLSYTSSNTAAQTDAI